MGTAQAQQSHSPVWNSQGIGDVAEAALHVRLALRTPFQRHAQSTQTFEACVQAAPRVQLPSSFADAAREVTPVYLDPSTVF